MSTFHERIDDPRFEDFDRTHAIQQWDMMLERLGNAIACFAALTIAARAGWYERNDRADALLRYVLLKALR
jgi:hypothetical protein